MWNIFSFATEQSNYCSNKNAPGWLPPNFVGQPIIIECPQSTEIAPSKGAISKYYNGIWYTSKKIPVESYKNSAFGLEIPLNGLITTINESSKPGTLPLIRGNSSFFVEISAKLDSDSPDHWPALWLNSTEHNAKQDDRIGLGKDSEEYWVEIDIDEGGFSPGMLGSIIEWSGTYPNYKRNKSPYFVSNKIDRSEFHEFSVFYDIKSEHITWYVDGIAQFSAKIPTISISRTFYIILSAQSRRENLPYKMYIKRIRVFQ